MHGLHTQREAVVGSPPACVHIRFGVIVFHPLITSGRFGIHRQNVVQTTVYDGFLIRGRKHACATNHGDFNKPLGFLHATDPRKQS